MNTTVDLSPLIQAVLGLAAIAVTTLGGWAVRRLAGWLGIQQNSAAVAAFDDALTRAVHAGAADAEDLIRQRGWEDIDVRNAIIAAAAPYAIAKFAPALKALGLDPADPGGATTRYLTDELNRIFPTAIAAVAASPATPPITPPPSA